MLVVSDLKKKKSLLWGRIISGQTGNTSKIIKHLIKDGENLRVDQLHRVHNANGFFNTSIVSSLRRCLGLVSNEELYQYRHNFRYVFSHNNLVKSNEWPLTITTKCGTAMKSGQEEEAAALSPSCTVSKPHLEAKTSLVPLFARGLLLDLLSFLGISPQSLPLIR